MKSKATMDEWMKICDFENGDKWNIAPVGEAGLIVEK